MTGTIAWVAVLVASNLANIIWRSGLHRDAPSWVLPARIGIIAVLWVLTGGIEQARLLRPYLLALIAALIGLLVKDLIYLTPVVTAWIKAEPWRDAVVVSSALKLLPVAAMAITLLDLSRRDLFLVRGNLTAPGRIPLTSVTVPWTWLGVALILVFGAGVAAFMTVALRPDLHAIGRLIVLFPTILTFSAVNAFSEEFVFRAGLLPRLVPYVGADQALWMTSVRFGLGHWFGNPPGLFGTVGATVLGLMLGKSMLETKGYVWAWIIHMTQDVVLFSLIVLSSQRA